MKKSEKGAVLIIEATIVFPLIFLTVFFILCLGNSYYVKSYMDNVAAEYAIIGANYASDELIWKTDESGYTLKKHDINPYQFKVSSSLQSWLNTKVKNKAKNSSNTLLGILAPKAIKGINGGSSFVRIDNGFLYSSIYVEIDYKVTVLPLLQKYGIGAAEYKSSAYSTINDNVELIRNADFVKDLVIDFSQTETGEKVLGNISGKFVNTINKIKKMFKFFSK